MTRKFGEFFPGNPQDLDELLQQVAAQLAAQQALLNSMTPEQRAQLQGLAEQLLEDMDLRWQVERLSANLRSAFPQAGWDRRPYNFSGQDPLGFAEAAQKVLPKLAEERGAQRRSDADQTEAGLASPEVTADADEEQHRRQEHGVADVLVCC